MDISDWIAANKKMQPPQEGWILSEDPFPDFFSDFAGPFYTRPKGGPPGVGFYTQAHHGNYIGLVHGGALMTLIDILMWDICRRSASFDGLKVATVNLQTDFMAPCRVGSFIHGTGEVMKEGGKLMFARGVLKSNNTAVMSFSGIMKKVVA
ncbi:MAG: PaaI family thioesterase [Pseudomonadota bacterium]